MTVHLISIDVGFVGKSECFVRVNCLVHSSSTLTSGRALRTQPLNSNKKTMASSGVASTLTLYNMWNFDSNVSLKMCCVRYVVGRFALLLCTTKNIADDDGHRSVILTTFIYIVFEYII